MKLIVNGREMHLDEGASLRDVLSTLGIDDPRGLAIAVDAEVVPRASWDEAALADGAKVEVLRAVQGG